MDVPYDYSGINKNNIHYKVNLNQWEIKILKSIKSKSKTEKKISKQVRLNTSIVSELITLSSIWKIEILYFFVDNIDARIPMLMCLNIQITTYQVKREQLE